MGFAVTAVKIIGSNMAGIGADMVSQYAFQMLGKECATSKFGKACVLLGSWTVGTASHAYVQKKCYEEMTEIEDAFVKLKDIVKSFKTDEDKTEEEVSVKLEEGLNGD